MFPILFLLKQQACLAWKVYLVPDEMEIRKAGVGGASLTCLMYRSGGVICSIWQASMSRACRLESCWGPTLREVPMFSNSRTCSATGPAYQSGPQIAGQSRIPYLKAVSVQLLAFLKKTIPIWTCQAIKPPVTVRLLNSAMCWHKVLSP